MIAPRAAERAERLALTALGDLAVALASLGLVVLIRRNVDTPFTRAVMPAEKFPLTFEICTAFAITLVLSLAMAGFYNQRMPHRSRSILGIALVLQASVLAILATLFEHPLPRSVLIAVPLIEAGGLVLWRRLLAAVSPLRSRSTVLFGTAERIRSFLDTLHRSEMDRLEIAGVVAPSNPRMEGVEYWGTIDDHGVAERMHDAEELLFISSQDVAPLRLRVFAIRGARGFLLLPSPADAILTSSGFGWVADHPLVEVAVRCGYGLAAVIKRTFDIVGASLLILLSSPIWIIATIATWIGDRGPVFIRQPRVGLNKAVFGMWKFRTMRNGTELEPTQLTKENDERFTTTGRWLRQYRIDELPQLLNVLRGEMSLVGPRPEQPSIHAAITRDLPEFHLRAMVRPGIAGLAQVSSEYDTHASVKLRYDLAYMREWSIWLDLRILLKAVATVLSGRGV